MPPEEFDLDGYDFGAVYGGEHSAGPSRPSAPEAHALIDHAVSQLGLDPREITDANGWRHLQFDAAHGMVNIVELRKGLNCLVVWSPIMTAPEDRRLRCELFAELLRLNHATTAAARFSLHENSVQLALVRPIHGLDLREVSDGIEATVMLADRAVAILRPQFDVAMPKIDVGDELWQKILEVWRLQPAHTRHIFNHLVENWTAQGGRLRAGPHGVWLLGSSDTLPFLAGLMDSGIVGVGWDWPTTGSRRQPENVGQTTWIFRHEDVEAFEQAMLQLQGFKATERSAHFPVDEAVTVDVADQFLDALVLLDHMIQHATREDPPPPPDLRALHGLKMKIGATTAHRLGATLESCTPATRDVFVYLIDGWHAAQGKIGAFKPGRVYLQLTVDRRVVAVCKLWPKKQKPEGCIELTYPLSKYFERHGDARRRYEGAVVKVPGVTVHRSGARVVMDGTFTMDDAGKLLKVLLRLKGDLEK